MTCPHCGETRTMRPNLDGDAECWCGHISYRVVPVGVPEPTRRYYTDTERAERARRARAQHEAGGLRR